MFSNVSPAPAHPIRPVPWAAALPASTALACETHRYIAVAFQAAGDPAGPRFLRLQIAAANRLPCSVSRSDSQPLRSLVFLQDIPTQFALVLPCGLPSCDCEPNLPKLLDPVRNTP